MSSASPTLPIPQFTTDNLPLNNEAKGAVNSLLEWYSDLCPDAMDLTGEFAGRELFMVEGDSLLRHVFRNGRVDIDDGLQLLHAIAEVERFLYNLRTRNCSFHVVFIDAHRSLCVPEYAANSRTYKFLFVRECIIRHLIRHANLGDGGESIRCFRFEKSNSEDLASYLTAYRPYFILTHDGAFDPQRREYAAGRSLVRDVVFLRTFIWQMLSRGFQIALINEINFMDRKAMTYVMNEGKLRIYTPQVSPFLNEILETLEVSDGVGELSLESPASWGETSDVSSKLSSEREVLHILALRQLLSSPSTHERFINFISPFLYHLSLLQYLKLDHRRVPDIVFTAANDSQALGAPEDEFFKALLTLETDFMRLQKKPQQATELDIVDAVDGRLFRFVLCKWSTIGKPGAYTDSQLVEERHRKLCALLSQLIDKPIPSGVEDSQSFHGAINQSATQSSENHGINSIYPFNNPVFDSHLSGIKLNAAQSLQEISKRTLDLYEQQVCEAESKAGVREPKKNTIVQKEWWELKREQKNQARIQRSAASLTGASGKELKPEKIITDSSANKSAQSTKQQAQKGKGGGSSKKVEKPVAADKKKKGSGAKKTANEIREANVLLKAEDQSKKAISAWKTFRTQYLDGVKALRDKLAVLDKHIQNSITDPIVLMEAKLLRIHLLLWIWANEYCMPSNATQVTRKKPDGYGIPALIFYEARQLLFNPLLTKQMKKCVDAALTALGFLPPKVPEASPLLDKPLTIPLDPSNFKVLHAEPKVGMDSKEFQLRCCGLYMDRNLDSKEDSRVGFTPDAWQVEVLDALDDDKSVFIVAPTSAGKTFIGYYAMEKILRADDDGVLVYVAPTKALVNQIAAELQARFTKDYKHPGKFLWAIATREYKVHNPLSCQILITVPYVLQSMLLSPQNARTWAPKIKRIILDEIHCLGSAEDGEVWEQLVLLAPCPIIAMSATVGNPEQFHQWLQTTQKRLKKKGKSGQEETPEVVLIEHKYRFNDLRKYQYKPPQSLLDTASSREIFQGMTPAPPTIGTSMGSDENFQHIHPITAISDELKAIPDDLSLESADCFTLWQAMCKLQTEDFNMPEKLHYAKFFSDVIKKADVIKWETQLKKILANWMRNSESPFHQVIQALRSPPSEHSRAIEYVSDIMEDVGDDEQQAVQETGTSGSLHGKRTKDKEEIIQALQSTLDMLSRLNSKNALPAILFNYNSVAVETITVYLIQQLVSGEEHWRENNSEWKKKMATWEIWNKQKELAAARKQSGKKAKVDSKDKGEGDFVSPKADRMLDEQEDASSIASFDPDEPNEGFSFFGRKVYSKEDLARDIEDLKRKGKIDEILIEGIKRGIGCHHPALPRPYRECVERLFRKGCLRVLIATGTLALGINMPCQTVCFIGDDLLLTPLNYRQASGRAGRRGFDLLGNVIFHGLSLERHNRLMRSRLPDLVGHFPTSTTLILRLFIMLHGSGGSQFAIDVINGLLSQARLSVADGSTKEQVLYCIRFSIEYLMRQRLLNQKGEPLVFASVASSLHYAEPGNFIFTYLLRTGQLWEELCDFEGHSEGSTAAKELRRRKLVLILAHIFIRRRLRLADVGETSGILGSGVKPLPELPPRILSALRNYQQEVLGYATTYAITYAENHITKTGEPEKLPLTGVNPHPDSSSAISTSIFRNGDLPIHARSVFAALSNHTDKFMTMNDLYESANPAIHFSTAWLPYIRIGPIAKLNPFLYEFFVNGGSEAKIAKTCRLRQSQVWFLLDDFKNVLTTITVAVGNLVLERGLVSGYEHALAGANDVDYERLDEDVERVQAWLDERAESQWKGESEKVRKRRELVGVYLAARDAQKVFMEKFEAIAATKRARRGKGYGKAGEEKGKGKK